MFEKIKAFFAKPVVKVVSWVVAGLSVVSLFLGGVGVVDVNDFVAHIEKGVTLVALLIAFITERSKK